MARRILLVDPDLDQLGELAAALRTRGFTTVVADGVNAALERARAERVDVVLAASAVWQPSQIPERLRAEPSFADLPCFALVRGPRPEGSHGEALPRDDLDAIAARVAMVPSRSTPPPDSTQGDVRGDLAQMPLVDLLQVLSLNRRTGVLGVVTASGAGELRISEGEVVDAVYRRIEGQKALFRLLGEREGTFAFVPGGPPPLRRVHVTTQSLVMQAMHQLDEVGRRRAELAPNGEALIASEMAMAEGSASATDETEREVLNRLQAPQVLEDLLDDVQAPDLEVLEATRRLLSRGMVRRIPRGALVTKLVADEKLPMLRALAGRLAREGFSGPPRLALAASPGRIATLASALRRIEDAQCPTEPPSTTSLPQVLATLRLGEGAELAVVGLPVAARFAALWRLVLPGLGAVVRVDATELPELDAACADAELVVLHAAALLGGEVNEVDPVQVAALIRSALETAAGG